MLYQKKFWMQSYWKLTKKFKTNLSKLLNKENCQENCKKLQISMMQLLMNPIWLTFTIKDKRAKGNDLMGNGPY